MHRPSHVPNTSTKNYRTDLCFLGALDGSHIKIDRPSEDQESYFNRKHYHSIQLQGLVNHEKKFIPVFIGYPGSVHDARVFNESDLPENLQNICDGLKYNSS